MRLAGRIALVTGASGGIGQAVAREFAAEGAAVALHYHQNRGPAEALSAEIRASGGRAVAIHADLTDQESCRLLASSVGESLGPPAILACFHGAPFRNDRWFRDFEQLPPDEIREALEVDLIGTVFAAQAVLPSMRAARYGRLIFTASTPVLTGNREGLSYMLAKAGVLALTRALAVIYGPDNIHVNALALGAVDTPAMAPLPPAAAEAMTKEAALGRQGTPREVARKAVFLASEDADFMTGQTLVIDGGYMMR